MDKNNIERMAELLRSGNTMLNYSCPECNSPVFKKKSGELFCPSCNREVILVGNNFEGQNRETQVEKNKKQIDPLNYEKEDLIAETFIILKKKILWLLNEIKIETQYEILSKKITLLKDLYKLLHFLSNHKF